MEKSVNRWFAIRNSLFMQILNEVQYSSVSGCFFAEWFPVHLTLPKWFQSQLCLDPKGTFFSEEPQRKRQLYLYMLLK